MAARLPFISSIPSGARGRIMRRHPSGAKERVEYTLAGATVGYRLFDAEGYGCREQVSPNVLAWPPRLENRTAALMAEWIGRRANRA